MNASPEVQSLAQYGLTSALGETELRAAALVALLLTMDFGTATITVAQRMAAGLDRFTLLAIPFFILAGNLMNRGGITNRIIRFANALVGWIRGGLGLTNIAASMLFGGITGNGDGILGADVRVPIGQYWALENDLNYLIPKKGSDEKESGQKFLTRGGRTVYGGGGITPDVEVQPVALVLVGGPDDHLIVVELEQLGHLGLHVVVVARADAHVHPLAERLGV